MNNSQLVSSLFLSLAVILLACRLVGYLARSLGQPQVVGEMIAGVLLGPTLLGAWAPEFEKAFFPAGLMPTLYALSQVGLALYMFLVGLEIDLKSIQSRLPSAGLISGAGIAAPMILGGALGLHLLGQPGLFSEGAQATEAALFMGAAVSITAFPMLARIIHEKKLTGTPLGALVLTAGSIDDLAAWCVLAISRAFLTSNPSGAVYTLIGGALYVLAIYYVGRPFLKWLDKRNMSDSTRFATILCLLMVCALITEKVGVHPVFGAFVLGAATPRGRFSKKFHEWIEPLSTHLLLPLFFAYSGLNTRLDLIGGAGMGSAMLLILLVSFAGKGLACYLGARLSGFSSSEAFGIGALMNSRGLMELIILNIGLEAGIISQGLFSIMVIMAILTTVIAGPAFELSLRLRTGRAKKVLATAVAQARL